MTTTCALCQLPQRSDCTNGHAWVDEATSAECPNQRLRRQAELIRNRLPPDLLDVQAVRSSPLYVPKRSGETLPSVDYTKSNVVIKGVTWNTFRAHLKFLLICKPFTLKVVSDIRLKDVYLGSESAKNMTNSERNRSSKEAFNVHQDLVSENYDLVIVRLGLMGHKNSAAANVLKEALMHRIELHNKPTWLFQSSDPHIVWHHSRGDEVEAYIEDKFEAVFLDSAGADEFESDIGFSVDDEEEEVIIPTEQDALVPADLESPMEVDSEDSAELDLGSGYTAPDRKKFPKRRY